ncbi:MAG: hypothetical protein AAF502_11085 [Bacteroidota bacterium]
MNIEKWNEMIEKKLAGKLTGKELELFNERLKSDPEFAEEYYNLEEVEFLLFREKMKLREKQEQYAKTGLNQSIQNKIQSPEITDQPNIIGDSNQKHQTGRRRIMLATLLSAAAVILVLVTFQFILPKGINNLDDALVEYWGEDNNPDPTVRSGENLKTAQNRFTNRKYKEAINAYLELESLTHEDKLILGICYLNTQEFDTAISVFNELAEDIQSSNSHIALWWKIGVLLNKQEYEAAKVAIDDFLKDPRTNVDSPSRVELKKAAKKLEKYLDWN